MDAEAIHVPVLLKEVSEGLQVKAGGMYIDCTLGTGGHAGAILEKSAPDGRLLGIDLDARAIEVARRELAPYERRITLVRDNFAQLKEIASEQRFLPADGVLLDLGVSSMQLQQKGRGFSFQQEGPLDMRFDLDGETTASDLVNELREEDLADILGQYGEEPKAKAIARAIVRNRPLETTLELANLVARSVGRRRKLHPATRTFQALRMAVNEELRALSEVLPQTLDVLASGGRMAILAFHSLEDRLVKRFLAQESRDCICPLQVPVCACQHRRTLQVLTRKPIRPSSAELEDNPRCRSAKLRLAVRL
jgi:16S rRNA (cytosine1402-N4)-methyltransferase